MLSLVCLDYYYKHDLLLTHPGPTMFPPATNPPPPLFSLASPLTQFRGLKSLTTSHQEYSKTCKINCIRCPHLLHTLLETISRYLAWFPLWHVLPWSMVLVCSVSDVAGAIALIHLIRCYHVVGPSSPRKILFWLRASCARNVKSSRRAASAAVRVRRQGRTIDEALCLNKEKV